MLAWLHAEPLAAHTPVHSEGTVNIGPVLRIFSVELSNYAVDVLTLTLQYLVLAVPQLRSAINIRYGR